MAHHLHNSIGVFTSLARLERSGIEVAATTAEAAGFTALWVADVRGRLDVLQHVVGAAQALTVSSAVLSMWDLEPTGCASAWREAEARGKGRVMLGIGASHPAMAARAGHVYDKPLSRLAAYVDDLEREGVPPQACVLGANGPKMLELAGSRTAGAITQMVTPERTAEQRQQLGDAALLATEVKIVASGSRDDARSLGRANLANYLGLPSYRKNLKSLGFTDADLDGGGSERLVDALVAGPDPAAIRDRVMQHCDAGADHVCLHVLSATPHAPLDDWAVIAEVLDTANLEGNRST